MVPWLAVGQKIKAGDVIVGFASYGQSTYETAYNSGIGSNGLSSARHDILSKFYADNFKESFDTNLPEDVVYIGKQKLTDIITLTTHAQGDLSKSQLTTTIGQLILSPTRTYAPLMRGLLQNHFNKIHGVIHCSGGGQTKCMKYLPGNFKIVKDNLFDTPEIFNIIKDNSGSNNKEMYEVFNMGCRLEIYCDAVDADTMIAAANDLGIAAQVIGRVEAGKKKELLINLMDENIIY